MQQKWSDNATLRKLAEKAIVNDENLRAHSHDDPETLLHELLIHQTELEMQNEALREAQAELDRSEQRYRGFFEHAPLGYLVLDETCRIRDANLLAAEFLGAAPGRLRGARFQQYLAPEDATSFERYRREMRGRAGILTAEFTVVGADERRREIRLEAIRTEPGAG